MRHQIKTDRISRELNDPRILNSSWEIYFPKHMSHLLHIVKRYFIVVRGDSQNLFHNKKLLL